MAARRKISAEAIRYLGITSVGLAADVAIALTLRRAFLVPLPIATATSFLIAVSINYVLFERFLHGSQPLSWKRLAKAYIASQGAFLIRLVAAWGLSYLSQGAKHSDAIVLFLSVGISFVANFFILRLLFR